MHLQWLKWSARSGGLPSPPLALEEEPPIAARRSGGALKLSQRGLGEFGAF